MTRIYAFVTANENNVFYANSFIMKASITSLKNTLKHSVKGSELDFMVNL